MKASGQSDRSAWTAQSRFKSSAIRGQHGVGIMPPCGAREHVKAMAAMALVIAKSGRAAFHQVKPFSHQTGVSENWPFGDINEWRKLGSAKNGLNDRDWVDAARHGKYLRTKVARAETVRHHTGAVKAAARLDRVSE